MSFGESKIIGKDGKPFYGQCMICDHLFTKEEENNYNIHNHEGHPDSCFYSKGKPRRLQDQEEAQARAHAKFIERNKRDCNCETCQAYRKGVLP